MIFGTRAFRRWKAYAVCAFFAAFWVDHAQASAARTPEDEAAWLGKHLRPIADEDWKAIAGAKAAEHYEVASGDTLYDISKRLFGDAKYWPKIWALNNGIITNPHVIRPKMLIAFLPGSGTSLPGLSIQPIGSDGGETVIADASSLKDTGGPAPAAQAEPNDNGGEIGGSSGRSKEWKTLPRQSWEMVVYATSPEVDKNGFDRRSRVAFRTASGFELEAMAASEAYAPLGKVTGGRSEAENFFVGDTVFVEGEDNLQVGETYGLTTEDPASLKASGSSRSAMAYPNLGTVKIIGVKDRLFVGTILSTRDMVPRGTILIPVMPRVKWMPPIPGPSPVEGIIYIDQKSSKLFGQHKQVFVDRGTDDGVRPGMVFRAYQHKDLSNDKDVTHSDYIIMADILVIQSSERASTGVVLRSFSALTENTSVVLLTDVTELLHDRGVREKILDGKDPKNGIPTTEGDLNNLDALDVSGGLGADEAKELRQLEKKTSESPDSLETAPAPGKDAAKPGAEAPAVDDLIGSPTPPAENPPPAAGHGDELPAPPSEGAHPATEPAVESPGPAVDDLIGAPTPPTEGVKAPAAPEGAAPTAPAPANEPAADAPKAPVDQEMKDLDKLLDN